jgi:hypothetical protein
MTTAARVAWGIRARTGARRRIVAKPTAAVTISAD